MEKNYIKRMQRLKIINIKKDEEKKNNNFKY